MVVIENEESQRSDSVLRFKDFDRNPLGKISRALPAGREPVYA